MGSFSFASVILSYFLVAGGLLTGSLLAGYVKASTELVAYLCLAAGAFVGGFVAARTSRGATIVEPVIGALAVIATVVAMVAGTEIGKFMWHAAPDGTTRFVAALAGCAGLGALAGAFLSEKLFGEATLSSVPWILYAALSTFGACFVATFIAAVFAIDGKDNQVDTLAKVMLVGVAIGCLLAGLAIGASTRTRALLASLVGGGGGVAGFFLLVTRESSRDKDTAAGIAVLAVGGAIITLVGSAIGWATVGKRTVA